MPQQLRTATIGKYVIQGLVGEGAMGAVYRAHDPVLNRVVAIKVMADGVASEDGLRERFLREAQAAGSLQHPNVVTIYDFGELDGHLFIAMEFLEGVDLETVMARDGAGLPLAAKLGVAVDVLSGLAYAHKRGIVHRDIKPANIRITEDDRAKIMDFGVAHLASSKMTRTGVLIGTPNYMAPEQITGEPVTPASDLFAVGAVLYELLTARRAFAGETLHAVMYRILQDAPPPPSSLARGIPPELDAVVARALSKEPAERYRSAADMASALTAVRAALTALPSASLSLSARLADEVRQVIPAARQAGAALPVQPTPRPRRTAAVLAVGALAVVGVGGWLAVGQPTETAGPEVAVTTAAAPRADSVAPPASAPALLPAPASAPASGLPPARTAPPIADPSAERAEAVQGASALPNVGGDRAIRAAPLPPPPERATPPQTAPPHSPALAAAAPPEPRAAAPSTLAPPVAAIPAPPAPAPQASAASSAAGPAAPNPTSAAEEIEELVARYARAIEARDVGAVRAAYAGLTPVQERNFTRFFASVRTLRAAFDVRGLDVARTTAEARLDGVYEFTTQSGEHQRTPVTFQASLRRDGGAWHLVSVR